MTLKYLDNLRQRAAELDAADPLARFRDEFSIPTGADGSPVAYLTGNSLGLLSRRVRAEVDAELDRWGKMGVDGHFDGPRPWYNAHLDVAQATADIVGALPHEVCSLGSLTSNLHALLVSFYRPEGQRRRIVIEAGAFPSDRYAVASQAAFHGLDPRDAVVELGPRPGEDQLRVEDIEAFFVEHGHTVAVTLLGGINYYTGQAYDLERITRAAQNAGAIAGFDLAHAAGNVELRLHDWGVDFAAWCSYKYLNTGPGGISGIFVHDRWSQNPDLPRFTGWWGNDPATRFLMPQAFEPQNGAAGWMVSNSPMLLMAAWRGSSSMFAEATMGALRAKSMSLTSLAFEALAPLESSNLRVITPRDPAQRGCQVSVRLFERAKPMQRALQARGVITDYRAPDVVRAAPTPLYNTHADVVRFATALADAMAAEPS
jgi:kynureninase